MSIVYLVALTTVYVLLLGVLYEAVVSVSRKPVWYSSAPRMSLVETVDRREQQLPFVGRDRRQPGAAGKSAEGVDELPAQRVA